MSKVYKQIPYKTNNVCPCCHTVCSNYYSQTVTFYSKNKENQIATSISLLGCTKCNIHFADKTIFDQYYSKKNKYRPIFFNIENLNNSIDIVQKANSQPVLLTQNINNEASISISDNDAQKKRINSNYDFVNLNSAIKNIYITTFDAKCVVCNGRVHDYVNIIPIGESKWVKIKGKYCNLCKHFYYHDYGYISKLIANKYAFDYTINTDFYIDAAVRNIAPRLRSLVCCFYLKEMGNDVSKKIMIVANANEVSCESDIYHYSSEVSRILLSAAIHFNKKEVAIGEKSYRIVYSQTTKDEFIQNRIIKRLNIAKGGGLFSKFNEDEIVDILLYAPFTQRYEIIKASYSKDLNYYYVDITVYKKYVEKYGNPGISIKIDSASDYGSFFNLNEESILHLYGYSVSQNDHLSESKRQMIIADVLDLGLMTSKDVISLLEFLISSHKDKKYELARSKWEKDIKFTVNYNLNPQRFMIAKL